MDIIYGVGFLYNIMFLLGGSTSLHMVLHRLVLGYRSAAVFRDITRSIALFSIWGKAPACYC